MFPGVRNSSLVPIDVRAIEEAFSLTSAQAHENPNVLMQI